METNFAGGAQRKRQVHDTAASEPAAIDSVTVTESIASEGENLHL